MEEDDVNTGVESSNAYMSENDEPKEDNSDKATTDLPGSTIGLEVTKRYEFRNAKKNQYAKNTLKANRRYGF